MRGAEVGLLITKGFRAVQEVQSQARDGNPFDYFYEKPEPIAPQSLTRRNPRPHRLSRATSSSRSTKMRCAAPRAELKAAGVRLDRGLLSLLLRQPGA